MLSAVSRTLRRGHHSSPQYDNAGDFRKDGAALFESGPKPTYKMDVESSWLLCIIFAKNSWSICTENGDNLSPKAATRGGAPLLWIADF